MNNEKIKLKDRVMAEIKEQKVSLRSKYIYLAEKYGSYGGFLVFFLLAVLFFVLVFWYFSSTDNLLYLRFGRPGMMPFLQTFPYFFVIALLGLIFAAIWIIKRIFYKKSVGLLVGILIILVSLIGGALIALGVHDKMEDYALQKREDFMFRPFVHHGRDQNERGIAGGVVEKNEDDFVIKNMCGEQTVKWLSDNERRGENDFEAGDFVVGVGEWRDDIFYALEIKNVGKDRLKMVVESDSVMLLPPPNHLPPPGGDWHPRACFGQ